MFSFRKKKGPGADSEPGAAAGSKKDHRSSTKERKDKKQKHPQQPNAVQAVRPPPSPQPDELQDAAAGVRPYREDAGGQTSLERTDRDYQNNIQRPNYTSQTSIQLSAPPTGSLKRQGPPPSPPPSIRARGTEQQSNMNGGSGRRVLPGGVSLSGSFNRPPPPVAPRPYRSGSTASPPQSTAHPAAKKRESILNIALSIQPPDTAPPHSPSEKTHGRADLRLPAIVPPKPPRVRELTLKRTAKGGFGFTLRRGVIAADNSLPSAHNMSNLDPSAPESSHGQGRRVAAVFAEPGAAKTDLLPGDRLLSVNGVDVSTMSRDEVIGVVKRAGETVHLRVQPIAELRELSSRSGGLASPPDSVHHAPSVGSVGDKQEGTSTLGGKRGGLFEMGREETSSLDAIRGSPYGKNQAKTEEQVKNEEDWLEGRGMWLVHKGGYSACKLLPHASPGGATSPSAIESERDGRCRVRLDIGGDILEVDENDLEKCNPPQFDRTEDLSSLLYMNESSILHTLRQRYGSSLVHTYSGPSLLILQPANPLNVYSDKVIQMFKGSSVGAMPPHVYAAGGKAYRSLLAEDRDQALILRGVTGSGKTENLCHILQYLALSHGGPTARSTAEKLSSAMVLLKAFGNAPTVGNPDASRFSQLLSVGFDGAGQLTSVIVQVTMMEYQRVANRSPSEGTFHIFDYLLSGADPATFRDLQLGDTTSDAAWNCPFASPPHLARGSTAPGPDGTMTTATREWTRIGAALRTLRVGEAETSRLFAVIASIYHLGVAGVMKGPNNRAYFARPAGAHKAAALLGCSVDQLSHHIFTSTSAVVSRGQLSMPVVDVATTGRESLEAFVIGLYREAFSLLLHFINRCLAHTSSGKSPSRRSILLLDSPGFQSGRSQSATFSDLCFNYAHEKLQLFFHDIVFTQQADRYVQESIPVELAEVTSSPACMVNMLDLSCPSQSLMDGGVRGRMENSHGDQALFWILEEMAMLPGATEAEFVDRLLQAFGRRGDKFEYSLTGDSLIQADEGSSAVHFTLNHLQGTCPVRYDATGWLKESRENPKQQQVRALLADSSDPEIQKLFGRSQGVDLLTLTGPTAVPPGGSSTPLRFRAAGGTPAAQLRRAKALQLAAQMDSTLDALRKIHMVQFVTCFSPLAPLSPTSASSGTSAGSESTSLSKDRGDLLLSVPYLRAQLRGLEAVMAIRHHRQGYPDFMTFKEFNQQYSVLAPTSIRPRAPVMDQKAAAEQIFACIDIDDSSYKMGLSQVFFRAGALAQLNDDRESKRAQYAVLLQAHIRRFLARKLLDKLRMKETAAVCLQKNLRTYFVLRKWEWWKLYIKLKPVIVVQRTEDELLAKEAEVLDMKGKVETLENERNSYKTECTKLEAQLSEALAGFSAERTAINQAAGMLEAETGQRLGLEKQLQDLQVKLESLEKTNEEITVDLERTKSWAAPRQSLGGDKEQGEEEDLSDVDNVPKFKFDHMVRENEYNLRKVKATCDEDLTRVKAAKQKVERQLQELQLDREEDQKQMNSFKKKVQKMSEENNDLKRHVEERRARNAELEKKQRRFDSDLQSAMAKFQEEQLKRQKLQQDVDRLVAEKFTFSQELENSKAEVDVLTNKNRRLTREMQELSQVNSSESEMVELRRFKLDLERRLTEQEEEINDLASENSELQNNKLKLHMDQERLRSKHSREMDDMEREMEDVRDTGARKVKNMEVKLSDLEEELHDLQMEKRDMERKLQERSAAAKTSTNPESERRLRNELRRTRALLQDAHSQLSGEGGGRMGRRSSGLIDGGSGNGAVAQKVNVRTLQAQLEDTQSALTSAMKAKVSLEAETCELTAQVETAQKAKSLAEERASRLLREKNELETEAEEKEEELSSAMRKYQSAISQCASAAQTLRSQVEELQEANSVRRALTEEIDSLQNRVENFERFYVPKERVIMLENRLGEFEQKMEFEQSVKSRLENQTVKLKEQCALLREDNSKISSRHQTEDRLTRTLQKEINILREELETKTKRDIDFSQEVRTLDQSLELVEAEKQQLSAELAAANHRIESLSSALARANDDEDGDDSDYNDDFGYSVRNGGLLLDDDDDDDDDDDNNKLLLRQSSFSPRRHAVDSEC